MKKTPLEKHAETFIKNYIKGTYISSISTEKETPPKKKLKRKRGAQFKI